MLGLKFPQEVTEEKGIGGWEGSDCLNVLGLYLHFPDPVNAVDKLTNEGSQTASIAAEEFVVSTAVERRLYESARELGTVRCQACQGRSGRGRSVGSRGVSRAWWSSRQDKDFCWVSNN